MLSKVRRKVRRIGAESLPPNTKPPDFMDISASRKPEEAIKLVKDWVTTVVGIQTLALGLMAVVLKPESQSAELPLQQAIPLIVAGLSMLISIYFGMVTLYMLPGLMQRELKEPNNCNIYSMWTVPIVEQKANGEQVWTYHPLR